MFGNYFLVIKYQTDNIIVLLFIIPIFDYNFGLRYFYRSFNNNLPVINRITNRLFDMSSDNKIRKPFR